MTPIGLGGSHSYGRRINDHGVAVGESLTQLDFARHAFISDHGITRDLGTLGGWDSGAFDVNNLNDVVGRSQFSLLNNETHAFLYRGGTMIDLALLPEVTAAGWTTLYGATAINERGQIVGGGIRNGVYHAFLLQAAPVPEPETLALLLGGLALLCLRRQVRQPSDRPE